MADDLDRLFDQLNDRYFGGGLPKYRVLRCVSQIGEHGFIDDETRRIWICDGPDPRATLLHEMCHIGTPGHGRPFRAKLRRLAHRGETWAEAERVYYLRQERQIPSGGWNVVWELARYVRQGAITWIG